MFQHREQREFRVILLLGFSIGWRENNLDESHPTISPFLQEGLQAVSDDIEPIQPLRELIAELLLVPSLRDASNEISAVRDSPHGDLNDSRVAGKLIDQAHRRSWVERNDVRQLTNAR